MICWKIQDTTTNGPRSLQLKYEHLTPNQPLKPTVELPKKSDSPTTMWRQVCLWKHKYQFLSETKSTNIYSRLNAYNFAFWEA